MNNQMNNYQYNNQYNKQVNNQNSNDKNEAKMKLIISILGLAIVLVAIIGVSFAIYRNTIITGQSSINTGSVTVSFTESNNSINIKNAIPITDESGKNSSDNSFDFAVTTSSADKATVPYTINVTTDENNTLDDSYVKIYLLKNNKEVVAPSFVSELSTYTNRANSKVLYNTKDIFNGNENEIITHYTLKLWIDKDFDIGSNSDKTYKLKVNVDTLMDRE